MAHDADRSAVSVPELRLLEGPNLYFSRPAVKAVLSLPGYQAADTAALTRLADAVGVRRAAPGRPHTSQRQRFLVRLCAGLLRQVATRVGTRLAVRGRTGTDVDTVVVAFPWRHRQRAVALGEALGEALQRLLAGGEAEQVLADCAAAVDAAGVDGRPALLRPRVPVVSVTGTNGKTTTTRLLAHMGMTCGRTVGWSSTEGVYVQGAQVVAGDYSGPSGARHVLTDRSVQLGILETARGGLLLKGMGVAHNDVSVVTNVAADHLGLHGVDTVDQLAEVKGIITRVTRKDGWVVLNGDDPRVRAMAATATGRIWMFSLDPDSPALRDALSAGGRGITVLDGQVVVLRRDADPERLVRVVDVPMTLSGLSEHNVANALAATAAALGVGLPRDGVVEGLRTFTPDLEHNPGRMNVWTLPLPGGGTGTVVVDLAHNEPGLEALLNVAEGLRAPGARVHLGLGGVGDRTDEILVGMAELAGRRADRVQIAHKGHYLRSRTVEDLEAQFVTGLGNVGVVASGASPTEVEALAALVDGMTDGDATALMCHAERAAVVQWLEEQGARQDTARDIRRKVVRARGEHELEPEIAAAAALEGTERLRAVESLLDGDPQDPRLRFELGAALDAQGRQAEAVEQYRLALAGGLREPHRFGAQLGLVRQLRADGLVEEAAEVLAELAAQHPDSAALVSLQALVDADAGRAAEGVLRLVDYLMQHATAAEDVAHRDEVLRAVTS